jgi:hypothetical protein
MDARAVAQRIGWRPAIAAVVLVLLAELTAVLLMVRSEDDRWNRCYGSLSQSESREDCRSQRSSDQASLPLQTTDTNR